MAYYVSLFSPETYEAFSRSERNISGCRSSQGRAASKIKPGDKLICYMTKLSRWVGVFEVVDGPFEDDAAVFYADDDPFVIRFHVKPLAWLDKEKAIPIYDDYDLCTNQHLALKQHPLTRADLDDFVACYHPQNRHEREERWSGEAPDGRWRRFTYEELMARDKANLDIFWIRDESLEETANLPEPEVLAEEIVEDLESALEQFRAILADLGEG